ncbi:MAG TPA: putative glycolipid-binding domain-containing protein [Gemmatimonadales bacterium]|nr:putative glycolipid-binding domain-containing protein [Gemmatimonadales bacterium]
MQTILWRRLDRPGHEAACVAFHTRTWQLVGTVVMEESGRPCRLDYAVVCDAEWHTLWARVAGWWGLEQVSYRIAVDPAGTWRLNGKPQPALFGCVDVAFSFTPATHLFPVRRLKLAIGDEARIRTARIGVPRLSVEAVDQGYKRIGDRQWFHEDSDGAFNAIFEVDDLGLVLKYGNTWQAQGRYPG